MQRSAQAVARPTGLRRLVPPTPLTALLVIVVVIGLAWALLVPPWQSPDESTHFAYVQSLAENSKLPGVKGRPGESSEEAVADNAVGATRGAFWPQASPPDWSRSDYAKYLAADRGAHPPSKSDGSGPIATDTNPPLYYLFASIPYLMDHDGTAFGQLYAMRLAGVLLLALTTVAAWLLAGETLGRRRTPQLVCAAVAGLLPMATFMSTAVNPDALTITVWTLALWLGARVINHRARGWDAVGLCAAVAAGILTKASSYALVGPALLALVIGCLRRPSPERRPALKRLAPAIFVLAVPVLGWLGLARALGRSGINPVASSPAHPFLVSQFLSYVWQFYLPRLPFMTPFRTTPQLPAYDIWLRQLAGTFGWLDVYLPAWVYRAAALLTGGIAIAAIALLIRLRDRRNLALLGFFVLALVALLVLLHVTEYRAVIDGSPTFLQGRYLLPAVGLLGIAVGLIISAIPARARPWACGLVVSGLLVVQTISLAAVIQAYYL